jgi:hypothetical protein
MKKLLICLSLFLGPALMSAYQSNCIAEFNESMTYATAEFNADFYIYCNSELIYRRSLCQFEAQVNYCHSIDQVVAEFEACIGN